MERKTIVKDKTKTYILSFLAITMIVLAFVIITSSLNVKTTTDISILNYNEYSKLDYNVYLKENNYFKENYLPKDKQYITSLIDYIDIFFNYDFSSSKEVNTKYKYKIIGTLNAKYKVDNNTKKVWTKDYVLLEEKALNVDNKNTFRIEENIKVNYDEYNKIINNFKKDYMLAVTSDLTISMLVNVDGEYVPAQKVFNTKSNLDLVIPLSEQTIAIKTNYKESNENQILTTEKIGRFSNFSLFFVGIAMLAGAVAIIYSVIRKVIQEDKKQTKYIKELKKILHDYDDIIVEVKKPPTISKSKSSEVSTFSELVNAQIEVRSPIVFSEISKNEVGIFVLFDKEHAYYYVLEYKEKRKA